MHLVGYMVNKNQQGNHMLKYLLELLNSPHHHHKYIIQQQFR